jgi:Ser/Thr protein kinase RdoA (MazF antagonist)
VDPEAGSDQVREAALLVRRLHDALDVFDPPDDAYWAGGWGRGEGPRQGPICHLDLAPYNVVASPTGDLAIIDWDGAGPGDRMSELAFAAESFALLRRDAVGSELGYVTSPDRVERLDAFVRSYGLPEREWSALADELVANAEDRVAFGVRMHLEGREPFASWWAADEGAGDREDLAVTERVVLQWRRCFA